MNSILNLLICIHIIPVLINCFNYPAVKRDESVKELHFGLQVNDAYRWLEIPDTKERNQFISEQNIVTRKYIDTNPFRDKIKAGLTDLANYSKHGTPKKVGSTYYYSHNSGLQNQAIIMWSKSLNDSNAQVFIDPNQLSADGTTYLQFYIFSPDAKWCAYGINEGGGDWIKLKIKNVATGLDLNETLARIKFTEPTWSADSVGFFYSYYDEYMGKADSSDNGSPNNSKIFYHRLNSDQIFDVMVAQFPEYPLAILDQDLSDDDKYLFIYVTIGTDDNQLYFSRLDRNPINRTLQLNPIITKADAIYSIVANDDNKLYIYTNKNAPNFRLIALDLNKPEESNWIDVIKEHPKDKLEFVSAVNGDYLLVSYLRDVKSALQLHKLKDASLVEAIYLPFGQILDVYADRDQDIMFYMITSFLTPFTIYAYNFSANTNKIQIFAKSELTGLNADNFVTKQVFYKSGANETAVNVPMFIVHHKNLTLDGNNPALLYAYGGFGISSLPSYSSFNAFFINNLNGVYALANIRGGGEYGEMWHKAGMLLNKQNVFDDFHAAAQYLIDNRYTNRNKLTIKGGSNGGLLVGATSNQRPDLYGCTIAQVGVMDMLRYHKFTVGYAWIPEYGNPEEEIHFQNLIKYSPLHNVPLNSNQYPAMLITTADHDDRVVPSHSFKFAAQVQYNLAENLTAIPLMIRIDTMAGHGGGKSTEKVIEESTDIVSFIMNALNITLKSRI